MGGWTPLNGDQVVSRTGQRFLAGVPAPSAMKIVAVWTTKEGGAKRDCTMHPLPFTDGGRVPVAPLLRRRKGAQPLFSRRNDCCTLAPYILLIRPGHILPRIHGWGQQLP